MNKTLLFSLFLLLYVAETLKLEMSLAPGVSVKNAFLYLIFAALALQIAVTHGRKLELVHVLAPFVLYIAYAICMWLSVLLIFDYPGYSAWSSLVSLKNGPIEDLMILLVFFYGLSGIQEPLRMLKAALWIVIIGNVITVIDTLGIASLGVVYMLEDGRAAGPFGHANQFAAFLALCLPLIAAMYWTETGFKKMLAGLGLLVSAAAFLLAVSRGGIVGLILGAVLGAIWLHNMVPARLVVRTAMVCLVVSVVTLVALTATGYTELLLQRFGQFDGDAAHASSGRSVIWSRLLGVMLEQPLSFITGFGWWAYQNDQAMGLFRLSPHNTYLNILYNLGIIGLALYVIAVANVARTVRAAIASANDQVRPYLIAFIIGFLGLLVAIGFSEIYSPWIYVWAMTGAMLRIAVSVSDAQQVSEAAAPGYPRHVRGEPQSAPYVAFSRSMPR